MDAGQRQKIIRRVIAEYVDDPERKRIMRRHVARILGAEAVSEQDRQEIVADLEIALALAANPCVASAVEDMVEAIETTPILHNAVSV